MIALRRVVVGIAAASLTLILTGCTLLAPPTPRPAMTAEPDESTLTVATTPAGTTDAVIEYVHDGDTLFLEDGRKVRLLGIDTPEIGDNLECYGDEATALLRSMLPEGTHVRVLADVQPLDQYDRSLLFIYTDDAVLVNLAMIEQGAAEAVVLQPNVMFADELELAEEIARAAEAGIWAC